MDIFVIKILDFENIESELECFQKKDISDEKKRKQHCLSYYLLDKILKDVYGIEDREVIFINKKPTLKTNQKFFSISHSEDYIVLVFSDYECGVDIEKIQPRDFKNIARRMKFDCNTLEEFYNEWTKYEAQYKLGQAANSLCNSSFGEYAITAVSVNYQENFQIHIYKRNVFSNLNI